MKLNRLSMSGAILFALVGCQSSQVTQQQKMTTALKALVGHSIAEVALKRGAPHEEFDVGNDRRAFQWKLTGQSPAAVAPLMNTAVISQPTQISCTFSFIASANKPHPTLDDWKIEDYRWNGAC
jgi:hypothetical protein